jgi:hypothetical protein
MSTEPERPIEKSLRDWARQRRQDPAASVEMHPVTRQILKTEAAKHYPPHSSPGRQGFPAALLALMRLKWAWGMAMIVGAVLLVWTLFPVRESSPPQFLARNDLSAPSPAADSLRSDLREEPLQLARDVAPSRPEKVEQEARSLPPPDQNQPSAAAAAAPAPSPMLAAAPPSTEVTSKTAQAPLSDAARVQEAQPAPTALGSSLARAPEGSAARLRAFSGPGPGADRATAAAAGASPSSTPLSLPKPVAVVADSLRADASAHRFVSVVQPDSSPKKKNAQENLPPHSILSSFQFEPSGKELMVTDQDGSVYRGVLVSYTGSTSATEPARLPMETASPRVSKAARSRSSTAPGTDSSESANRAAAPLYRFQVSGTNLSSNLKVTFVGDLFPPPVAEPAQNLRRALTNLPSQPGTRILGRATVGQSGPWEIRAIPVQPAGQK